jgi:hypothetical protein
VILVFEALAASVLRHLTTTEPVAGKLRVTDIESETVWSMSRLS